MTRIVRRLEENPYQNFDEPRPRDGLGPKNISLPLQDPFGNHLELLREGSRSRRMALPLMWGSATSSWK